MTQPDLDTLFTMLSNSRRRNVIRALAKHEQTVGDLAEIIAREEHDIPSGRRVDTTPRKRAYISLYQNHLDALDAVGIIDYDDQSGAVSAGPAHERALSTLWFVVDEDASLREYVRDVVRGEA